MATMDDVSVGYGVESTPGTVVTPTVWPEFTEESLDWQATYVESAGLAVGGRRLGRSARRTAVTYDGGGAVGFELWSKGMGKLLRAALGTGVSTLVAGTTYQEQFTLSSTLPSALTIQKRVTAGNGTTYATTYGGCYAKSITISLDNAGQAKVSIDWDAMNHSTAVAATSPSAISGGTSFSFAGATLTMGGTVVAPTTTALASGGTLTTNVRDFSVTIDQGLSSGRYNIGNAGLKSAALAGKVAVSGSMNIEYTDNTVRDAILANTETPLVLTLTSAEALSTGYSQFQIYLPASFLTGSMPQATGELPTISASFVTLDNQTATPVVISARTSDTAL